MHKYNQFYLIKIGMGGGKLKNFETRGGKMENTENYRGRMIITLLIMIQFISLVTFIWIKLSKLQIGIDMSYMF